MNYFTIFKKNYSATAVSSSFDAFLSSNPSLITNYLVNAIKEGLEERKASKEEETAVAE